MKKYLNISFATKLIPALMLFWALTEHPYSYYILLKWVVLFTSIFTIYKLIKKRNYIWIGLFSAMAIIFNPIFPIHLTHTKWNIIDIISGLIFLSSLFFIKEDKVF